MKTCQAAFDLLLVHARQALPVDARETHLHLDPGGLCIRMLQAAHDRTPHVETPLDVLSSPRLGL